MNRIDAEPAAPSGKPISVSKLIGSELFSTSTELCAGRAFSEEGDAPCSLFAPLHYERNYAYPLLVWLHGNGDGESQLRRIMPMVSLRNYVAAAPRGTLETKRHANQRAGYGWSQTPEHIARAEQVVQAAITAAQRRFNVRSDRIFIAGYEGGGTMAMRIAGELPNRFAGVLSLCGPFPKEGTPLAQIDRLRQLPLFVAACRQGSYYATDEVCDNLRLFHTAGLSVTLREYPGDDGLSPLMLADVDRWMMEQITPPLTTATSDTARFPNAN